MDYGLLQGIGEGGKAFMEAYDKALKNKQDQDWKQKQYEVELMKANKEAKGTAKTAQMAEWEANQNPNEQLGRVYAQQQARINNTDPNDEYEAIKDVPAYKLKDATKGLLPETTGTFATGRINLEQKFKGSEGQKERDLKEKIASDADNTNKQRIIVDANKPTDAGLKAKQYEEDQTTDPEQVKPFLDLLKLRFERMGVDPKKADEMFRGVSRGKIKEALKSSDEDIKAYGASQALGVKGGQFETEEARKAREEAEKIRQFNLELERKKAKDAADAAKEKKDSSPKNVFQQKKMQKFGESAAEWATKDRVVMLANSEKIGTALDILAKAKQSGSSLFGPTKGRIPDFIRGYTNQDALTVRDSVHSAIIDTLRPTLGAQFTAAEGTAIKNLSVNETLSDEENIRRIQMLQKFIDRKIQATDDLYRYIETNGTDAGFPFQNYGMVKIGTPERPSGLVGKGEGLVTKPSGLVKGQGRSISKKQYSKSRNQTRITYSDGSSEVQDGKK